MASTRTFNTKRNVLTGFLKQTVSILLPFITRTILLYSLGSNYQGLSGLFTSILQVLNLADLGFSTAVMYVLYEPIAKRDDSKICAILAFLKTAYRIIGFTILIAGLLVLPFLHLFIAGEIPADVNIYVLYLIYLFNAAISYLLFSYKTVLVNAMQRADLANTITTITSIVVKTAQIVFLLSLKSYYAYVFVIPIGTLIDNLIIQYTSTRLFPSLVAAGGLDSVTKKTITVQIKAIFIDRLGDVARNSFDNIVLSSLLGLTMVAVYDNYFYIFTAVYGAMAVIKRAVQASVGNCIVAESVEYNYGHLIKFNFIFMWIVGFCCAAMLCMYQPFMYLWMKGNSSLLLSDFDMSLFVLYFYLISMNQVRNLYLEGYGLFSKCVPWYICEAIFNIILNFVLGYLFGVTGILLATILTIFIFNFITRTWVLFKYYFHRKPYRFFLLHLCYFLVTFVISFVTASICSFINSGNLILDLLFRAILVLCLSNFLFFLVYNRTNSFYEAKKIARSFILSRGH